MASSLGSSTGAGTVRAPRGAASPSAADLDPRGSVRLVSEGLETWARQTLASVDGLSASRLRHIAGVARRAAAACAALKTDHEGLVVAAAWLHDIGYAPELADTGCHPIDGARHLRQLDAPDELGGLVAYHSGAENEAAERGLHGELAGYPRPRHKLLDVLTYADMTTDTNGFHASVESRLRGIHDRYDANDPVYLAVGGSRTYLLAAVRRVQDRLPAT